MNELIQQLEYKGYQFDVSIESEVAVNGADAFHQPLMTNRRYYEPLNAGMLDFTVNFVIASLDVSEYKQRRSLLLRLLREGKVGEMYHPYFGRMAVACDRSTIRINESITELGICNINAGFKEVTFKLPPEMVKLKVIPVELTPEKLIEDTKAKNKSLQSRIKNFKQWSSIKALAIMSKVNMLKTLLGPVMSKLSTISAIASLIGEYIDRTAVFISRQVTTLQRFVAKSVGTVSALKAKAVSIRTSLLTGVKLISKLGGLDKKAKDSAFSAPTSPPAKFGNDLPTSSYVMLSNEHIDNQAALIDACINAVLTPTNELGALQRQETSDYEATKRLGSIVSETITISNMLEPKEVAVLPNQDLSNELATKIATLESEFLNAYIALRFIDTVNATEFNTLEDVIETLDVMYRVVELLGTFKELPDDVVAQFKFYIATTATDIYNNIDEVQTITDIETKNLPLRVLAYRLYGDTTTMDTLQALNGDWFDLGESPDKIKILE